MAYTAHLCINVKSEMFDDVRLSCESKSTEAGTFSRLYSLDYCKCLERNVTLQCFQAVGKLFSKLATNINRCPVQRLHIVDMSQPSALQYMTQAGVYFFVGLFCFFAYVSKDLIQMN